MKISTEDYLKNWFLVNVIFNQQIQKDWNQKMKEKEKEKELRRSPLSFSFCFLCPVPKLRDGIPACPKLRTASRRQGTSISIVEVMQKDWNQKMKEKEKEKESAALSALFLFLFFVPETGIEPAHSCERQILSLLRLPIPPPGQEEYRTDEQGTEEQMKLRRCSALPDCSKFNRGAILRVSSQLLGGFTNFYGFLGCLQS
jgi:hypothetical protein